MRKTELGKVALIGGLAVFMAACSQSAKAPDVSENVHKALDQPAFKDVSVSQDRNLGVVTLKGHVMSDADKAQAGSIAQSAAGNQVISNEIAVVPAGDNNARSVASDLDKGISENLDAALLQNNLKKDVTYHVDNSVVTLTGNVKTQAQRSQVQQIAAAIPNVQQVVNELQVRNQPATTSQE